MAKAKHGFHHADPQEDGEQDHIPEDDMLRLLAGGPGGLVEQVVVPARTEEEVSQL